jgi:hypothetical protein
MSGFWPIADMCQRRTDVGLRARSGQPYLDQATRRKYEVFAGQSHPLTAPRMGWGLNKWNQARIASVQTRSRSRTPISPPQKTR